MQTRKKKLIIERMKSVKWILLVLLIWLTQFSIAEVTQIDDNYVKMTTENLRVFVQDSEELHLLKEVNTSNDRRYQFYIGANAGTYGAGINGGVIF